MGDEDYGHQAYRNLVIPAPFLTIRLSRARRARGRSARRRPAPRRGRRYGDRKTDNRDPGTPIRRYTT